MTGSCEPPDVDLGAELKEALLTAEPSNPQLPTSPVLVPFVSQTVSLHSLEISSCLSQAFSKNFSPQPQLKPRFHVWEHVCGISFFLRHGLST